MALPITIGPGAAASVLVLWARLQARDPVFFPRSARPQMAGCLKEAVHRPSLEPGGCKLEINKWSPRQTREGPFLPAPSCRIDVRQRSQRWSGFTDVQSGIEGKKKKKKKEKRSEMAVRSHAARPGLAVITIGADAWRSSPPPPPRGGHVWTVAEASRAEFADLPGTIDQAQSGGCAVKLITMYYYIYQTGRLEPIDL